MANYDLTYEGPEVQDILDAGNTLEADGYIFCGVATPSTNPGTPTEKVYYLALKGGVYSNFNNITLPSGISILLWNGSWNSSILYSDEIYEPAYNYFSRTTIAKWNVNYKVSRLLKVTNDVSITNVCAPTATDACCLMYNKDGVLIRAKFITSESYTAYDDIVASDLEGAAFFRICGDMRNPPVFNYTPSYAIDY